MKELDFNCKTCDDLMKHKLIAEGRISEEWECKKCGTTRMFSKKVSVGK